MKEGPGFGIEEETILYIFMLLLFEICNKFKEVFLESS